MREEQVRVKDGLAIKPGGVYHSSRIVCGALVVGWGTVTIRLGVAKQAEMRPCTNCRRAFGMPPMGGK